MTEGWLVTWYWPINYSPMLMGWPSNGYEPRGALFPDAGEAEAASIALRSGGGKNVATRRTVDLSRSEIKFWLATSHSTYTR